MRRLRTVLLITFNDLRQTLSDRSLLLLMFAAPLAVATIISVTFGDLADEASPIEALPIGIVNQDRGSPIADFGEQFVRLLGASEDSSVPAESGPAISGIGGLVRPVTANDVDEAREWLLDGTVSAVVVLPEDLSRSLAAAAARAPARVVVITRPDREISGSIAQNLTRSIMEGFAGGLATTRAVVGEVAAIEGVPGTSVLARPEVQRLMDPEQEPPGRIVNVAVSSRNPGGVGFNPLVAFGATQAIFFALFTANANAASIMEEERDGTFVRLRAAPTTTFTLLTGKLVSTIAMVVVQLVLLFVAFTLIGSRLDGELTLIWGTRFGLISVGILLTSFAAAGVGAVVASAARTPEQASVVGTVVNMFMAITGGAFGFRFNSPVRYASAVYWGSDVFETLAGGGTDIWLNVVVLAGFGGVAFVIALGLLRRRFNR